MLGGTDLHDDADGRAVDVFTDDERPLVFYDDRHRKAVPESPDTGPGTP